jgi:hypothetical protein
MECAGVAMRRPLERCPAGLSVAPVWVIYAETKLLSFRFPSKDPVVRARAVTYIETSID